MPNLIGFLLILLVGFIVAKVVEAVVTKLLAKTGVDDKVRQSDANKYVEGPMPGASVSNGGTQVSTSQTRVTSTSYGSGSTNL